MKGQIVGYIRVSTTEQNTERQLDGLELDRVFTDKASGKSMDRPELQAALKYVRAGDTLIVHSMDRLARNLMDLRRIVDDLTKRGVVVRFEKEFLTFTGDDSPMSHLLLSVMGAVAEFERALMLERQREGIAIAKANGVYKGRPFRMTEERAAELCRKAAAGEKRSNLAREYSLSLASVYAYIQRGKISPISPETGLSEIVE